MVIPIVLCVSGTAQVSWAAFSKSQLRVIAANAAFEASKPDVENGMVISNVGDSSFKRLKMIPKTTLETQNGVVSVELQLSSWLFLSLPFVSTPSLAVRSFAVAEN